MKKSLIIILLASALIGGCQPETDENSALYLTESPSPSPAITNETEPDDLPEPEAITEDVESVDSEHEETESVKSALDKSEIQSNLTLDEPLEFDSIANNYTIFEEQTYGEWKRRYEVYYPSFTDETTYRGLNTVKLYYTTKVEEEKQKMAEYFKGAWGDGTLFDSPSYKNWFYRRHYDVEFFGQYLVVGYYTDVYSGGARVSHYETADNFDTRSGQLLSLEHVFGDKEKYVPVLNEVINKYLEDQKDLLYPDEAVDITMLDELAFRINDEGIKFIFQEYSVAPLESGIISVTIPYEELESILIIGAIIE